MSSSKKDNQSFWSPSLFPKQFQILNSHIKYLLVSGPRLSGKTIGNMHRICRHLWEVDNARVAMFHKTIKAAKLGGVWEDLTSIALPEWIDAGFGMEYISEEKPGTPGPKVDNQTRTSMLKVRNCHGGESTCLLFSIEHDAQVEQKLKNSRFSMMYFAELSNYDTRQIFSTSSQQLRDYPGVSKDQLMWLADTNPSDEGEESWIYKIWYDERLKEDHPYPIFQKNLGLIEVFLHDNPTLTEEDIEGLKATTHHDPFLYERYVNGLWVSGGMAKRHFSGFYRPEIHIIGDASAHDPDDWEVALPSESSEYLIAGSDLGDVNLAAVFIDKVTDENGMFKYFTVLDDILKLGEKITLEDFTAEYLGKMDLLEEYLDRRVVWNHWSDEQAIKQWSAAIGGYQASFINKVSKGRISLRGVPKEKDSVRYRVRLLKMLLMKDQLFVSANCIPTHEMLTGLRIDPKDFVKRYGNKYKHIFDALTYALQMESVLDVSLDSDTETNKTTYHQL